MKAVPSLSRMRGLQLSCVHGRIAIKNHIKQRLFAESAGHCQNPSCLENLLIDLEHSEFHIAELAHIIASSAEGPRGLAGTDDQNALSNLVVLCPNCHTKVDKAPLDVPSDMLGIWKYEHAQKIESVFGVSKYLTRPEARLHIEKLLNSNKLIFEYCSPDKIDRWNPENELGMVWLKRIVTNIIPNNRKILVLLDANFSLLSSEEKVTLEKFRIHVEDLETKHLFKGSQTIASRFPAEISRIFEE